MLVFDVVVVWRLDKGTSSKSGEIDLDKMWIVSRDAMVRSFEREIRSLITSHFHDLPSEFLPISDCPAEILNFSCIDFLTEIRKTLLEKSSLGIPFLPSIEFNEWLNGTEN